MWGFALGAVFMWVLCLVLMLLGDALGEDIPDLGARRPGAAADRGAPDTVPGHELLFAPGLAVLSGIGYPVCEHLRDEP